MTTRSKDMKPFSLLVYLLLADTDVFVWCSRTPYSLGAQSDLDPAVRNFAISMPVVGAFIIGSTIFCCCFFKYGLKRWRKRLSQEGRVLRNKVGITYQVWLQSKKKMLEDALEKVISLQNMEPDRSDLDHVAEELKEEMNKVEVLLFKWAQYTTHSLQGTQQSINALAARRVSIDRRETCFVNPIFSPLQSVACGYIFSPSYEQTGERAKQTSAVDLQDFHVHSKPKGLEMFLTSGAGGIRRSTLTFPEAAFLSTSPPSPLSSSGGDHEAGSAADIMHPGDRSVNMTAILSSTRRLDPQHMQSSKSLLQNTSLASSSGGYDYEAEPTTEILPIRADKECMKAAYL